MEDNTIKYNINQAIELLSSQNEFREILDSEGVRWHLRKREIKQGEFDLDLMNKDNNFITDHYSLNKIFDMKFTLAKKLKKYEPINNFVALMDLLYKNEIVNIKFSNKTSLTQREGAKILEFDRSFHNLDVFQDFMCKNYNLKKLFVDYNLSYIPRDELLVKIRKL